MAGQKCVPGLALTRSQMNGPWRFFYGSCIAELILRIFKNLQNCKVILSRE